MSDYGAPPGSVAVRPDGGNIALREDDDGIGYWAYAYDEGGDNADEWDIVFPRANDAARGAGQAVAAIACEQALLKSAPHYLRTEEWERSPQTIIDAALAYATLAQDRLTYAAGQGVGGDSPESYWPWNPESFHKSEGALRSLQKAGALIAEAYDAVLASQQTTAK